MSQYTLLTLNMGSSSIKFQLFALPDLAVLIRGNITQLGSHPLFSFQIHDAPKQSIQINLDKAHYQEQAIAFILDWIRANNPNGGLSAVAHRVVHGGELFTHSVCINSGIIKQLKLFNPLAPLHQPHNIAAIELLQKKHPQLVQIACFDTAFHASHKPLFEVCALPLSLREQGIRRYGFHGLSFEWIAHVLKKDHPDLAQGRIIIAHLGNGASLCALHEGISVDTTMSLTALDGLPMGTRCGSIDPGIVLYMINELGMSAGVVEDILYNHSGLLGLSGITHDVKQLQASLDDKAQFALDYFSLKVAQFIGMMTISLGGIDGLVFTGGIGENSQFIREKILNKVQCLKPFSVLVIPTHEETMMAMHALTLLKKR